MISILLLLKIFEGVEPSHHHHFHTFRIQNNQYIRIANKSHTHLLIFDNVHIDYLA